MPASVFDEAVSGLWHSELLLFIADMNTARVSLAQSYTHTHIVWHHFVMVSCVDEWSLANVICPLWSILHPAAQPNVFFTRVVKTVCFYNWLTIAKRLVDCLTVTYLRGALALHDSCDGFSYHTHQWSCWLAIQHHCSLPPSTDHTT